MSILSAASLLVAQRWKGYTALVAALGGEHVFSRAVPPDFTFPDEPLRKYITIGDKTESDVAVMGSGRSMTLTAHSWTRGYYDDAPVEHLMSLQDEALEEAPLFIPGYGNIILRNDGLRAVLADPDDLAYRHGIIRYRISTLKVDG